MLLGHQPLSCDEARVVCSGHMWRLWVTASRAKPPDMCPVRLWMIPASRQKPARHRGKAGDYSHHAQFQFLTRNCEHLIVLCSTESLDGSLGSKERSKQQRYDVQWEAGRSRAGNLKLPYPVWMCSKDPLRCGVGGWEAPGKGLQDNLTSRSAPHCNSQQPQPLPTTLR